jgi:hypothetical protein
MGSVGVGVGVKWMRTSWCMVCEVDVGACAVIGVVVESRDGMSSINGVVGVEMEVDDVGLEGGGSSLGCSTASPGMRLLTSSHTPSPFSWVLSFLCVRSFSSISFAPPPLPLLPISSLPLLSPVA